MHCKAYYQKEQKEKADEIDAIMLKALFVFNKIISVYRNYRYRG